MCGGGGVKYTLEEIRNFSADADFGGFISEKVALTMLKDLLAEVDRLNQERMSQCAHCVDDEDGDMAKCVAKLQAAEARAAQHLADQEYLVALERKRAEQECVKCRARHGVEE